jgi:hypothetical protein
MPLLGLVIISIGFITLICVVTALWSAVLLVRYRIKRREYLQSPELLWKRLYIPAGLFGGSVLVLLLVLVKPLIEMQNDTHFPQGPYDMTSPKLRPFQAMYAAPRTQYGFTAYPKHASVMVETRTGADAKTAGYDAMLHIYSGERIHSGTEWDVSFKRVNGQYRWIGEQETWTGPHGHMTRDGELVTESISISYNTQPGLFVGEVNTLQVSYTGTNTKLSSKDNLTLKDVRPILKQWRVK